MKKMFVVGRDFGGYFRPWRELFDKTTNVGEADCLLFTGGEDVTPSYYGDKVHPLTGNSPQRDEYELFFAEGAKKKNLPMLGICRGAQFLTVFAGGKLYQHINRHGGNHEITTYDGYNLVTSSTHHQQMRPEGVNHKLLAFCEPRSNEYHTGTQVFQKPELEVDVEVVWYPEVKALCIQGHPEIMGAKDPFVLWCQNQIKSFILSEG